MKANPIILSLFLCAITLTQSLATTFPRQTFGIASTTVDDEVLPNDAVEEPAQYPGGAKAMLDFIGEHLEYPQQALQDKIFGKVVLRFIIKEDGGVGDVEILKSLSPECDQAAIRAVKSLPKFTPPKMMAIGYACGSPRPSHSYYKNPPYTRAVKKHSLFLYLKT